MVNHELGAGADGDGTGDAPAMRLLHDPDLLSRTIGMIYDCVLDPSRWETVLGELGALIGGRRGALALMSGTGEPRGRYVLHGLSQAEMAASQAAVNPLAPLGLVHPVDKAFVCSRDFGLDALKATRMYRDVLGPRGDLDFVGFVIRREGDAFAHWMLITQQDRGPITAEEAAGFELVAPHLRRAVEISNLFGLKRLEADTYRAALDELDAAVLILDARRGPVHLNPRAEAELAAGDVLRLRGGRVTGATDSAEAALRRAGKGALSDGGLDASVQGVCGAERLLFAVGLDTGRHGPFGEPSRFNLLVLRAPREDTRNPIVIAARLFGLTPAQVQVLFFLAQGHPPEAIADILGISTATVRTHLADLFRRTGTSRQAELVARTLSLASPLRPQQPG